MALFLGLMVFWLAVGECAQSTLTYYLNNCLGDLELQEAEDWIGYFINPPANTVSADVATNWTLSYAAIPNDHVILDLDWGYWYGKNETYPLLHGYIQVLSGYPNLTVRHDLYPWKQNLRIDESVGSYQCWQQNVSEPAFFGVWVWYKEKDTLETCKAKTTSNPGC
eukprot:UN08262